MLAVIKKQELLNNQNRTIVSKNNKIFYKKRQFKSLYSVYLFLSKEYVPQENFQKSALFFMLLKRKTLNNLQNWRSIFEYDCLMLARRNNQNWYQLMMKQDEKRLSLLDASEKVVHQLS